jgi:hypothetical protein
MTAGAKKTMICQGKDFLLDAGMFESPLVG